MANEKEESLCVNQAMSCTQYGIKLGFGNTLGRVSLASDTLFKQSVCYNCRNESFCLGLQNKRVVNFIEGAILEGNR